MPEKKGGSPLGKPIGEWGIFIVLFTPLGVGQGQAVGRPGWEWYNQSHYFKCFVIYYRKKQYYFYS